MADEGEDKGVSKDAAAAIQKAAKESEALTKFLKKGTVSMKELGNFADSFQSIMQKTDVTTGGIMTNIYAMNTALGKSKMEADKVQGFMMSSTNAISTISEKAAKLAKTTSQTAFFTERIENMQDNQKEILEQMATAQGGLLKLEVARETSLSGAFLSQAAEYKLMVSKGAMTEKDYKKQIQSLKQQQDKTTELEDQLAMEEAIAQEILDIKSNTESWGKSLQKTAATAKAIASDPMALGALALNETIKAGKKAYEGFEDLRESGMSAGQALEGTMKSFSINSMLGLSDTKGAVKGLVEEFGTINNVSGDTIDQIGTIAHEMGISGTEAAKLTAQMSQMTGETTEVATNTLKYTNELAKANGIAPGKITEQMAANTKDMHKFTKGGSKEFAKIAVEAQKIGIDMETAASAASGLLDFESSIEKQMEASVLLGKEINLDKARQLALDGKSVEAAKEVVKQLGGINEFNKMNVLEQQAAAEAAGMTVDQIKKSMDATQNQGKYADENASQAAEAAGHSVELAAKLGGFLGENALLLMSMLQFMASGNAMRVIGNVLETAKNTLLGVGKGIAFATSMITSKERREAAAGWIKEQVFWAKQKAHLMFLKAKAAFGVKGAAGRAGALARKMGKGGSNLAGGGAKPTKDQTLGTKDKASKMKGGLGKKLKDLAKGVKAFGSGKVILGALVGLPATAVGMVAMVAAIPALAFLALGGAAAGAGLVALAKGMKKAGGAKVLIATVVVGAIALSMIALGGAAILFAQGGAAGTVLMVASLYALVGALALLGGLGLSGVGFVGVALVLATGVALLAMGYAVKLAAEGMSVLVDSFTGLFSAITLDNLIPIFMLGPALTLAGLGMIAFAASLAVMAIAAIFGAPALFAVGLGMMVLGTGVQLAAGGLGLIAAILPTIDQAFVGVAASITSIVTLLPAMLMMGTALFSMAAGLAAFAVAGVFTLPTIMGLIALSLVAPILTALGDSINFDLGGGSSVESKEDSKMDALIGEVRSLKAAFETPGVINMDGKKVGDVLRLSITNSNVK